MLLKINQIKNLGVFADYASTADMENFERYNLIYGLNGSGKTTLSRFFEDLKIGKSEGFQDLRYKVTTNNISNQHTCIQFRVC